MRAIKALIATTVISAFGMLISMLPLGNISETLPLADGLTMEFGFLTYQTKAACFLPNKSGVILLAIGTLFSLGLLSQTKDKKERRLLFQIILLLIFTAFHTMARAPVIALFIAILFLLFSIKPFRMNFVKNLSVFFMCGLILFILFMIMHLYVIEFAENYYQQEPIQSERAFRDRLIIWGKAIKSIADNDLYWFGLGAGAGTYYVNPEAHVHNIIFSVFVDFGFMGLLILFILLFSSLRMLYIGLHCFPDDFFKAVLLSAVACMITISISGLLDYDYNFNLLWYVAAIGTAVYRNAVSYFMSSVPQMHSCGRRIYGYLLSSQLHTTIMTQSQTMVDDRLKVKAL